MTREETIKYAESKKMMLKSMIYNDDCKYGNYAMYFTELSFVYAVISTITPPTQERLERVCGAEWIKKHRHRGGFRRYTGTDDMGEVHTITVDERAEYDDLYCSTCGKQSADNFLNFCPNCGSLMTDKAVQIVIKRLEALNDATD